ncbi:MAG: DUF4249 domain-containing protein, partial [Ginsengibacter sp.]
FGLVVTSLFVQCKREYLPPELSVDYNYLVIEGTIINSMVSPTTILLSRTRKLTDTVLNIPETNASLSIESNNGQVYSMSEIEAGKYFAPPVMLNTAEMYRLNIVTSGGKKYLSDFVEVKKTPSIDSLNYIQPGDVTIFVNSHDPGNETRYYRWEYIETFQYHAQGQTDISVNNGLMYFLDSTNQIYNCWHINSSTDIFIASTAALNQDVVYRFPLVTIPQHAPKIGIRYSIEVRQYAISQEAYQYYQILKKNTEQQGSIFDVQPSQLKSNIHSLDDPSEIVIGYVTASDISIKRLFISRSDLVDWQPVVLDGLCDMVIIGVNPSNYLIYTYPDPAYVPWYFTGSGGILVVTKKACVDCREQGGTNQKPSYW